MVVVGTSARVTLGYTSPPALNALPVVEDLWREAMRLGSLQRGHSAAISDTRLLPSDIR